MNMELSQKEINRVKKTLSWLPEDAKVILDVGCGDGRVTNQLDHATSVFGTDTNMEKLSLFNHHRCCASSNFLPFPDKTFDLVLITEVLEHLPEHVFNKSREELSRVSRKYILASVPYNERLRNQLVRCPVCKTLFNAWGHLKSFKEKVMPGLFPGFKRINFSYIGEQEQDYNPLLLFIRQTIGNSFLPTDTNIVCTKCNNVFTPTINRNIIPRICDFINYKLFSAKIRMTWMLALYQRFNEGAPF